MIPDHVVMLIVALIVWWVLFRWGSLICTGYALWYFCSEQWGYAVLAFIFACFIEAVKAPTMFLTRRQGYRGPWI